MVKFSEVVGTKDHNHDDLAKFVKTWFKEDDDLVLGAFPAPTRSDPHGKKQFNHYTAHQLTADSTDVYAVSEKLEQNIYVGIAPIRDPGVITEHSRGSGNTGQLRGVWADLDVKGTGFESQEQILEWLNTSPLPPTIIVRNGESGGIHGYWRIQDNDLLRLDKEHLLKWWAFLQAHTPTNAHGERIKIDRLTDTARLARLPGMIYWPKVSGAKYGTIALAGGTYEQIPLEALESLSADSYRLYQATLEATKANNRQVSRVFKRSFTSNLERLLVEERVNGMDWRQILVPHGWTELSSSSDGTRQWARPGTHRKSANTDYVHQDGTISDVMSLHSESTDTGLSDLKETGIPLTKFRVLLRLSFNDDVPELITAIEDLIGGQYDI